MMELPKHNSVLRGLYVALLVSMFGFLGWWATVPDISSWYY
ncbi:hypothetical protein [Spongorhabdus nitratireducens]